MQCVHETSCLYSFIIQASIYWIQLIFCYLLCRRRPPYTYLCLSACLDFTVPLYNSYWCLQMNCSLPSYIDIFQLTFNDFINIKNKMLPWLSSKLCSRFGWPGPMVGIWKRGANSSAWSVEARSFFFFCTNTEVLDEEEFD